jgi:hypothetical protein
MNLINSTFKFSFYNNLYSVKAPDGELDINELIEVIKYGYIKPTIEELRNTEDKERFNEIKRGCIQGVTLSGIFKARNKESLIKHSGLMQVDLDDVNNYEDLFNKLINDPLTYVCFKSPGGKGIKIIVKVLPHEETHLEQFYALERYYKDEYGIIIDSSCKDIARCLLLSYDPYLYCNPFASVFEECHAPYVAAKKVEFSKTNQLIIESNLSSTDIVTQLIQEVSLNKIDITDTYENWMRLGFALSAEFGEAGRSYYHQLSQFNEDYDASRCDAQFSKLAKSNTGAIKFATVIYLAQTKGIEFKRPTRNVAHMAIKGTPKPKTLKELLLAKRNEIAAKEHKSIYSIFQDRTLIELENNLPTTLETFRNILGVTLKKSKEYANDFLPLIKEYLVQEGKLETQSDIAQSKNISIFSDANEYELFQELRHLRYKISLESNLATYNVFLNYTLEEIVKFKPTNRAQLQAINGIGEKRANWFGNRILELVGRYV